MSTEAISLLQITSLTCFQLFLETLHQPCYLIEACNSHLHKPHVLPYHPQMGHLLPLSSFYSTFLSQHLRAVHVANRNISIFAKIRATKMI